MVLLVALSSKLVASVLQPVIQQLSSPALKEISQIWNVDKERQELLATYGKISASIDKWEIDGGDSLETWFHQLEGYCYDTEDLVDYLCLTFATKKLRSQIIKPLPSSMKHLKLPHKITRLRGKLERLTRQIEGVLDARRENNSAPPPRPPDSCYRSPLLDKTPLVFSPSRDQIKQNIITELTTTGSSDQRISGSGVAIIGMDGLGKTSLARSIREDARIKNHFPLVLTACVSGEFQLERVVSKLVEDCSHSRDVDLEELLDRQRALIILDDVWDVALEDWDRFKCNYFSSSPGWKILTTTRNPKVAEVTMSTPSYLDAMTDEECKELIMQRAKLCGIWDYDVEVISGKCKGMPIVANRLGLILACKTSVDELRQTLQKLKNEPLQGLPEFKQVFHSLKLNEPKLPPHLKRCVAYLSLFSPNRKFNKDELIQLWEAEGFVQTQQGGGLQPTGSECFDEMLSRSILKPLKSSNDEQTIYEMHDFSYEFAQRLASEAFRRIDEGTPTNSLASHKESLRHLSLICENIDVSLLKEVKECTKLRTFLLLHQNEPRRRAISYTFFRKLEWLRLLDLSYTNVSKLLEPVSPLKLLRYLDLSKTDIQTLPEPINPLCALQILKLEDCFKLDRLPKDLYQLTSLTHLHVNMKRLARLPSNLGMLTNLQILSSYIVGCNEGKKAAELKNMENLRDICISRLENISDRNDAEESMLSTKKQLKRLVLEWDNPGAEINNASEILEGLKPHNDLKELVLRNYRCQQFPTWLSSSSLKLASMYLQNCQDCEILPSLGKLPLLKTLVLHSIDKVKRVDGIFCGQGEKGFQRLESLEFRDMTGLERWTGLKTGDMPCLHSLKIIGCQRLMCLPSLIHQGCLVYMEINNCPVLESLPEIPSSMNSESGQLIIVDSPLVEERCQAGGADWPKIKDMAYIRRFQTTATATTSTILPPQNNEVNEDEAAPTRAPRMIVGDSILLQGIGVLVKRWMAMFNKRGCFYKPNWVVLLLVVTLIPIIYGVIIRCADQ